MSSSNRVKGVGESAHDDQAARGLQFHLLPQLDFAKERLMKLENLQDLLVDQIKDLYSAENQLIKALPKMAKAASSEDLRDGFNGHLEETRNQVQRLEQICKRLGVTPKGKKCAAMEGLIEEGKELMEEDAEYSVRDAGLIAAAQKVEHYEMASYGTARAWAEQLGLTEVVDLLSESYEEEKATDEKLSELAESVINLEAEEGDEEVEEEPAAKNNGRKRDTVRNR